MKLTEKPVMYSKEDGFTLVEILVVILVIGILTSIAIPVFLNQRQTANDATVESNAHSAVLAIETYIADNETGMPNADYMRKNAQRDPSVAIAVHGVRDDYCVEAKHSNGKRYTNKTWAQNNNIRPYYLYASVSGGIVQNMNTGVSTASCALHGVPAVGW